MTAGCNRPKAWSRSFAPVLAMAVLMVACSSTESVPSTTVMSATPSPTTTSSSTTTTTTLPYVAQEVRVNEQPEIAQALGDFYTWLEDRDAPQPSLPDGLAEHLLDIEFVATDPLEAEVSIDGALGMGMAGVAVVEQEDIILLVNDLDRTGQALQGWRVVGAWIKTADAEPWFGEPIRHVLAIGTDAREWQDPVRFRGDSLHILSSNTDLKAGGILGFPRDSWIETPYGTDKFTHVNAIVWTESDKQVEADLDRLQTEPYLGYVARWLGLEAAIDLIREGPLGADVTVQVAEQLTGIPIEGYVLTGFRNFQLLFNDYGPVTVDIPFSMADGSSGAFFKAGVQELYGKAALAFSRNRHLTGGDFTRSFHQGLVILGRLRGVQDSGFTQLPWLVSGLVANTWTNLSLEQLITLGASALMLDPEKVGNKVVHGSVATRGGASVVLLSDSAETLYRDLDDGVLGNETQDESSDGYRRPSRRYPAVPA